MIPLHAVIVMGRQPRQLAHQPAPVREQFLLGHRAVPVPEAESCRSQRFRPPCEMAENVLLAELGGREKMLSGQRLPSGISFTAARIAAMRVLLSGASVFFPLFITPAR